MGLLPFRNNEISTMESQPKKKKKSLMDSRESWWMAVASALTFFVCMGFTRADGVMFVALMQKEDTTRETASWPFNLAGAAVVFMAPVTGVLSARFSPLAIGLCGSLLFAAGYSACYFSTNIYYLSVCLGVIKGSGQAMMITVIPALINNCFKKYRATAMGIATTGTPLGGFVLPLLVQFLLEEYGLRGTFLVLGGIALHATLGSSVYVFYPKTRRSVSIHTSKNDKDVLDNSQNSVCNEKSSHFSKNISSGSGTFLYRSKTEKPLLDNSKDPVCNEKSPLLAKNTTSSNYSGKTSAKFSLELIKNVFGTRGFYFVAINQIISLQLVEMFSLVVVDYSVDKGISPTNAVFLITITSGLEILGRLCFGWVTDKQFLSRPVYMLICQTLSASIVLLFSFSHAYYLLAVLAGFLGMIQGSTLSVTHVIFSDYLKKEEIALAVAFARSFHGLASVARSPIIGYFRDYLGSYDLLFLSASTVFFAAGLMWLTEALILLFIRKRNKARNESSFS